MKRFVSSVVLKSVVNRKDIIPLFKHLHPDLLMGYSNDIKSKNMSCIQNLNDLWDTLQCNLDDFYSKSDSTGNNSSNDTSSIFIQQKLVDIKFPFRESYDFSCYMRRDINDTELESHPLNERDLHDLHVCIIKIPNSLCKRQTISFEIFIDSIKSILLQNGQLFQLAGIQNPWKIFTTNTSIRKQQNARKEEFMNSTGSLGYMLESRLFDKWIIKNNQSSIVNNQNTKNLGYIFGNNGKESNSNILPIEIDSYLKSGKVMIIPMLATEEFKAVTHLRNFLIDYGDVLNFTRDNWQYVTFILHVHEKNNKSKAKNHPNINISETEHYQAMGYTIDRKGVHFIVTVPHLFKVKIILEFLRKYLPQAKLML